jgi:hypothetical protein
MLGLLPGVDLQVLGPARLGELPRFDAAILDRVAPLRPPPVPALLIAPARVPWLAQPQQESTQTTIARWDQTHPLLAGVPLRDVLIDRAALREPSRGARTPPLAPVARGPDEEALILATGAGQPMALVNFALEESNFLLQPGFPAFLANAVVWLTRSTQPAAHPLGPVRVPLPDARVQDLDGRELPVYALPGATRFDAAHPGVYTVVGGEQRMRLTVNLLDVRTTRINDSRGPPEQAAVSGAGSPPRVDPALLLLLAAAALIVLEWWGYTRRMTV